MLGTHFCEVSVDPYAPRDMRAVVHLGNAADDFPLFAEQKHAIREEGGMPIVIEGPGFTAEGEHQSILPLMPGNTIPFGVREFVEAHTLSEEAPVNVRFGYRFPLTSVTWTARSSATYGDVGHLIGAVSRDGESVMVEPLPMLDLQIDGVAVQVGSTIESYPTKETRYPSVELVTESILAFDLPRTDDVVERAREVARSVLQLLSVVERDRIRWSRENYVEESESDRQVAFSKTYRWCPAPKDRSSLYAGVNRAVLVELVRAYGAADPDTRSEVDLACTEFEIAATAGDIETSLVRWHSVVDFFCKRAGNDHYRNAGRRIVATCDGLGVWLGDLCDPELTSRLRPSGTKKKGDAFPFTEMRNGFVHDGFGVFDGRWDELLEARRSLRAVAERMLLARLNANAGASHVGTKKGPV